ncbi:Cyclopropane-fatty-acyl-phospholipid synthase [Planctomycetes bacterium Pla163]|uniref:Cyclopropane-fatty-acyl-phospholipid synthase n=1 Tax=Rohdeia mirabilis TaxID=2528008 RepID=A0A518CVQ6_9BACT|nr:Cyclopropane-fatty-acyl-phospholipid synthase [Planctomycetes bacterium Pla163]
MKTTPTTVPSKPASTSSTAPAPAAPAQVRPLSWMARAVLARLRELEHGTLELHANGQRFEFGATEPRVRIAVHDDRFWSSIALRGSIGAGEAYAAGWWSTDDPIAVVRTMVRNHDVLSAMEGGLARLSQPFFALYHRLRRNSHAQARANIAAHYDLSNEFFALFLDRTMTYSCGIFDGEDTTLEEASLAKIDRLCKKLDLQPHHHLLEIGTGWGALAIHAAREYGCRVTTTTISQQQYDLAKERIEKAGLEDRITLLFEDYRNLTGTYDRLVSVEMIEAVGHQYFGEFYEKCGALLKPDGYMAIQAITIADSHYERAKGSVDFIQRYIFPGSCIPSITALQVAMSRNSDLTAVHLEDFGAHYARTLGVWHANLRAGWDEAKQLGLSEDFLRLWEFYFAYCAGGFAERHIGVSQVLYAKPFAHRAPVLPPPVTAGSVTDGSF